MKINPDQNNTLIVRSVGFREKQLEFMQENKKRNGMPLSEFIRRAVDRYMDELKGEGR